MFKIIALVVALSGQPLAVFASKKEYPVCPPQEVMLQFQMQMQILADTEAAKVREPICVPSENVREEAEKLLRQKDS